MRVTVSLPDPVFYAAERLAAQLEVSRSKLYSQALAAYLGSRETNAVTEKLDVVYGTGSSRLDPAWKREQLRVVEKSVW